MGERPFQRWWEVLAILLALLSLWPWLLAGKYPFWQHPLWRYPMYVMGAVMLVLFIVNVRRLWRMGHPPEPHDDA